MEFTLRCPSENWGSPPPSPACCRERLRPWPPANQHAISGFANLVFHADTICIDDTRRPCVLTPHKKRRCHGVEPGVG